MIVDVHKFVTEKTDIQFEQQLFDLKVMVSDIDSKINKILRKFKNEKKENNSLLSSQIYSPEKTNNYEPN